jgi:hypothetical protein
VAALGGKHAAQERVHAAGPARRSPRLTDRGIAERLWVTTKTVQTHSRHIFQKLSLPASAADNRRVHAVLTYLRQ